MKLISVNVEQDKHLTRVRGFLEKEKAEVVVMLECPEDSIDTLVPEYPYREFLPNFRFEDGRQMGVVIASKEQMSAVEKFYCDKGYGVPLHGMGTHRPAVVGATIKGIKIYATHFTWTPKMSETVVQHQHLDYLLTRLASEQIVLCGDFNIPRGNGAYGKLAAKYRNNIPNEVKTTIHYDLHRAKREGKPKFEVVVDYIWSTPKYEVSEVRVVSGVSDHCGLVGQIRLFG